jgi:hypothetical protein
VEDGEPRDSLGTLRRCCGIVDAPARVLREEGDPSGLMGSFCELLSCLDAPIASLRSCKVSSRTHTGWFPSRMGKQLRCRFRPVLAELGRHEPDIMWRFNPIQALLAHSKPALARAPAGTTKSFPPALVVFLS